PYHARGHSHHSGPPWLSLRGAAGGVAVLVGRGGPKPPGKPLAGKRVVFVLPHDDFWNLEYEPVRQRLEEDGAEVMVASTRPGLARPYFRSGGKAVPVDLLLSDVKPADTHAVIFIAGPRLTGDLPGTGPAPDA